MQFQGTLVLRLLHQSVVDEVKKLSYLNLLLTLCRGIPLICGFVEFQEGKDVPESAVVFFPTEENMAFSLFCLDKGPCFSEP